MTKQAPVARCARSWEVEAVRDGRLRGHDAESLRRHLQTCSRCALEKEQLESVGDDLQRLPAPYVDALAGRRIRQRLLMQHNESLLRQEGAPRLRWQKLAFAAAGLLLVGAGWGLLRTGRAAPASSEPNVEVLSAVNAQWRREAEPHRVRIVLDDGELRLKIRRFHATDRVTVVLPDGAIEDLGTVLDVSVAGGHTMAVRVEQGSVILRLDGDVPRTFAAGESWLRPTPPAASAVAQGTTSETTAPAAATAAPAPNTSSSQRHGSAKLGGLLRHEAAGRDGRGRSMRSEETPNAKEALSEKAEDETYLHIVDLLQRGRSDEARRAAKDYLLRFPNGFRRVEVLNIATRAAP